MTPRGPLVWLGLTLGCAVDKDGDPSAESSTSSSTVPDEPDTTATDAAPMTSGTTDASASTSTSTGDSSSGDAPLPAPDPSFCPLDWSGPTTIQGTAPFGKFTGSVAWFEWQFCNGFYPLVLVVEDPAEVQDLVIEDDPIARAIAFSLPLPGWETSALAGSFTPEVYAMVDGQWTDVNLSQGEVEVDASVSVAQTESPTDLSRISGQFSLKGGQGAWDLEGSFEAVYCGPLNDFKAINCD